MAAFQNVSCFMFEQSIVFNNAAVQNIYTVYSVLKRHQCVFLSDLYTFMRCDQKITVIFKCRELSMFDFRNFFFCYVGTHVCYTRICWQY